MDKHPCFTADEISSVACHDRHLFVLSEIAAEEVDLALTRTGSYEHGQTNKQQFIDSCHNTRAPNCGAYRLLTKTEKKGVAGDISMCLGFKPALDTIQNS